MQVDTQRAAPDRLTREGMDCLPDNRLDIASWGIEGEVANQIGPVRNGLVGEFDLPDAAVVKNAVTYYLYLGFGAEARQLLRTMDVATPDHAIWQTMAHVLDGDDITGSAFAEMEVCDTAAALWSVLSAPGHTTGTNPRIDAVLRSFSGLPLHLRRHLGSMLAARFLARDDTETARAIRDAILRAPGDHGPSVRLMAAEIDLAQGGDGAAIIPLMAEPGQTGAEATVALVRATVARGAVVDAAITTALESLLLENKGGELEQPLQESLSLALASQDRYLEAFSLAGPNSPVTPRIWDMLAQTGTNSALLQHAIIDPEAPLPEVSAETDRVFASRLIGLGFSMPALRWLTPTRRNPAILGEADRLLTATAEIARRDGRAALRALAGMETDEAISL
ncbi:MAG: hypothetical protein U1D06_10195, partial [Paracoccaceae bacterium]|nr:hypothetical protein [Paracoccaceae bacterium]